MHKEESRTPRTSESTQNFIEEIATELSTLDPWESPLLIQLQEEAVVNGDQLAQNILRNLRIKRPDITITYSNPKINGRIYQILSNSDIDEAVYGPTNNEGRCYHFLMCYKPNKELARALFFARTTILDKQNPNLVSHLYHVSLAGKIEAFLESSDDPETIWTSDMLMGGEIRFINYQGEETPNVTYFFFYYGISNDASPKKLAYCVKNLLKRLPENRVSDTLIIELADEGETKFEFNTKTSTLKKL